MTINSTRSKAADDTVSRMAFIRGTFCRNLKKEKYMRKKLSEDTSSSWMAMTPIGTKST